MVDLKLDLINNVKNDKYYRELELIRLASEPNMNYKKKIKLISNIIKKIALLNTQLELIDVYFKDEQQQNQQNVPKKSQQSPPPRENIHQGHSHGE